MTNWDTIAQIALRRGAQQKPAELIAFLNLLSQAAPQTIVEIGVARGGTLWAWQQIAANVIGIDTTAPSTDAAMIIGDSHQPSTFEALAGHLAGTPIDVLFIDGDHSYDGVRSDHETYSCLVRPGGLIAFHDIVAVAPTTAEIPDHGVAKYWAEIRNATTTEIVDTTPGSGGRWGDQWGGIGIITP